MTSFIDCINAAIETGKVKPEKANEVKAAWQKHYDEAVKEGLSERAASDRAAFKSMDELGKFSSAKKWQKVNEIKAAAALWRRFQDAKRPDNELVHLFDEIDVAKIRIEGQAMALFAENLEQFRPKIGGLYQPKAGAEDIIFAAYGQKAPPEAKRLYDEIAKTMEFLRKRANMEGANIHENKNRRLPQQQNRDKLRNLERQKGLAEARQEWVQDHMDNLDWDEMEADGKPIPVDAREGYLQRAYLAIATEGDVRLQPGQAGAESLAARMARERFFYYKSPEAWLQMQEKYGAGSVFEQMTSSIAVMARDIAMLEKMGPNPLSMLNYLERVARKRAADIDEPEFGTVPENVKPDARSMKARTAKEIETFKERYRLHNHLVNNGSEWAVSRYMGGLRTGVNTAILTGAFIANLADLGIGKHTALINGIPATGYMRRVMKTFAGMPSAERRKAAVRDGLLFESATNMALAAQRYMGPLDGPYALQKFSDISFRVTWLTPWTQASRWAWGQHVMFAMGDAVKTPWEKLSFRESMEDWGITKEDWDTFRKTPLYEDDYGARLRPFDVMERRDLDRVDRQRLADKFMDWVIETGRYAVPHVDTRTQVALGQSVNADTGRGQVLRVWGMLKAFPTVIFMNHLRDGMAQQTLWGKTKRIGGFVATLTLAGAMVTQLKEMRNGRDPLPMDSGRFWAKALLNGGGLGFLGDALFNNLNMNAGGLSELFSGPAVDFLTEARDLSIGNFEELWEGKPTKSAKEVIEFGAKYLPVPWQAKLLYQRMVVESLLEMADPAAASRLRLRAQRREREYGQGSWWPEGSREPLRSPNFTSR